MPFPDEAKEKVEVIITEAEGPRGMQIGVIGVGLIGGSIALAARHARHDVALFDPMTKLDPERFAGSTICSDQNEVAAKSELLIVAAPVSAMKEIAVSIAQSVRPSTVVSDLASVKGEVARWFAATLEGRCSYVPSHPMAGSEKRGSAAARPNLFSGSIAIVLPDFVRSEEPVHQVEAFWKSLGSRPVRSDVQSHDWLVGAVSHFPHLLASLLVEYLAADVPGALDLAGPGFKDLTRIASGSPELWTEILLSNREVIQKQIAEFRTRLDAVAGLLKPENDKNLQAFLDAAKRNRDRLMP